MSTTCDVSCSTISTETSRSGKRQRRDDPDGLFEKQPNAILTGCFSKMDQRTWTVMSLVSKKLFKLSRHPLASPFSLHINRHHHCSLSIDQHVPLSDIVLQRSSRLLAVDSLCLDDQLTLTDTPLVQSLQHLRIESLNWLDTLEMFRPLRTLHVGFLHNGFSIYTRNSHALSNLASLSIVACGMPPVGVFDQQVFGDYLGTVCPKLTALNVGFGLIDVALCRIGTNLPLLRKLATKHYFDVHAVAHAFTKVGQFNRLRELSCTIFDHNSIPEIAKLTRLTSLTLADETTFGRMAWQHQTADWVQLTSLKNLSTLRLCSDVNGTEFHIPYPVIGSISTLTSLRIERVDHSTIAASIILAPLYNGLTLLTQLELPRCRLIDIPADTVPKRPNLTRFLSSLFPIGCSVDVTDPLLVLRI